MLVDVKNPVDYCPKRSRLLLHIFLTAEQTRLFHLETQALISKRVINTSYAVNNWHYYYHYSSVHLNDCEQINKPANQRQGNKLNLTFRYPRYTWINACFLLINGVDRYWSTFVLSMSLHNKIYYKINETKSNHVISIQVIQFPPQLLPIVISTKTKSPN